MGEKICIIDGRLTYLAKKQGEELGVIGWGGIAYESYDTLQTDKTDKMLIDSMFTNSNRLWRNMSMVDRKEVIRG